MQWWILQNIKRSNTNLAQTFPKKMRGGNIFQIFYEASITLTTKPDKDILRKWNYRPISFRSTDTKVPDTVLAYQIAIYKRITHNYNVRFLSGM